MPIYKENDIFLEYYFEKKCFNAKKNFKFLMEIVFKKYMQYY